jgi:DNA-binding response OmpR family regulator
VWLRRRHQEHAPQGEAAHDRVLDLELQVGLIEQVILLTARAHQEHRAAGRAAGADTYITKPFSPLDLVAIIERTLEQL